MRRSRGVSGAVWMLCALLACAAAASAGVQQSPSAKRYQRLDALDALWTAYQFHYIDAGRVVSHD